MQYIECRASDTVEIGSRIRLTVMQRLYNTVTLAVVAPAASTLRFHHDGLRREPCEDGSMRYLLPLVTGDCFQLDDVRICVGLYLDRQEIADNDGCDVQLQVSSTDCTPAIRRLSAWTPLPAERRESCSP